MTFCSEKCRDERIKQSHGKLCAVLPSLFQVNIPGEKYNWPGIALLVLEMIWKIPLEELKAVRNMELKQNQLAFVNGVYSSENYAPIYHLSIEKSFTSEEVFQATTIAYGVVRLLQRAGYFDTNATDEDIILVGGTILHHLLSLPFHISEFHMTRVQIPPMKREDVPQERIHGKDGVSIHAVMSLVNHSCQPNSRSLNAGSKSVLRAMGVIRKGEEITESYGNSIDSFINGTRETRYNGIQKFKCLCLPCIEKWPQYERMPSLSIKCPHCDAVISIRGMLEGAIPAKCPNKRCKKPTNRKAEGRMSAKDVIEKLQNSLVATNLKAMQRYQEADDRRHDPTYDQKSHNERRIQDALFAMEHLVMPCKDAALPLLLLENHFAFLGDDFLDTPGAGQTPMMGLGQEGCIIA